MVLKNNPPAHSQRWGKHFLHWSFCLSPGIIHPLSGTKGSCRKGSGDKWKHPAWHQSHLWEGNPASPCASSLWSGPAQPASLQGALTGLKELPNSEKTQYSILVGHMGLCCPVPQPVWKPQAAPYETLAHHRQEGQHSRASRSQQAERYVRNEHRDPCGGHSTLLAHTEMFGDLSLPAHYHSVHCLRILGLLPQIPGFGTLQALYEKENQGHCLLQTPAPHVSP